MSAAREFRTQTMPKVTLATMPSMILCNDVAFLVLSIARSNDGSRIIFINRLVSVLPMLVTWQNLAT